MKIKQCVLCHNVDLICCYCEMDFKNRCLVRSRFLNGTFFGISDIKNKFQTLQGLWNMYRLKWNMSTPCSFLSFLSMHSPLPLPPPDLWLWIPDQLMNLHSSISCGKMPWIKNLVYRQIKINLFQPERDALIFSFLCFRLVQLFKKKTNIQLNWQLLVY